MKITRRRNILLVANYSSDVGFAWWLIENFWAEIATHFHKCGRTVVLVYPEIRQVPERIRSAPLKVETLDFGDRSPEGRKRLRDLIRDCDISSIYLTDRPALDPFYWTLRRWSVTSIVNHDHTPGERTPPGPVKRWVKRLAHRLSLWSCDHYIGVSEFVVRRFTETHCIPPEKCSLVRNGIVPIDSCGFEVGGVQSAFGIPQDALVVVTVGRASVYKGIDFVVECADVLCNRLRLANVYFLHLGDGPERERLRSRVRQCGLSGRFIFGGERSDVRDLLPSCHIALHASHGEAFSLAILEYMSAALAAVVPDHCGNAEAIKHFVTGILYRPGDLNDAVRAIQTLVNDEGLRQRLGSAASNSIRRDFDIRRTNSRLVSVLDKYL